MDRPSPNDCLTWTAAILLFYRQDLYAFTPQLTYRKEMSKIQKNEREIDGKVYEQFRVTIPREIAKARGWDQGTEIEFKTIKSGDYSGQLRIEEVE